MVTSVGFPPLTAAIFGAVTLCLLWLDLYAHRRHHVVPLFDAALWSAFYYGDQPAGVLLLNPLLDRRELELVYLGLAPPFRGKGLATRLMRRALCTARVRGDAGIHLAVDQANTPAVKLYQHLGFRATARKLAMICVLK